MNEFDINNDNTIKCSRLNSKIIQVLLNILIEQILKPTDTVKTYTRDQFLKLNNIGVKNVYIHIRGCM